MNTTAIFRRHKWLWAFVFLVLLLVVARASLPSIVKDTVNEKLMALPAYDGQVDDVDLALWRGAYRIEGIRIVKTGSKEPTPFFDGERIDFSIEWRSLLKGSLVSECEMWRPKVNLVQAESEQQSQLGKEVNWADGLERLFPFRFNTIQCPGRDGDFPRARHSHAGRARGDARQWRDHEHDQRGRERKGHFRRLSG